MGKLKSMRYWVLGMVMLTLCVVGQPAIAHLSPPPAPLPTAIAQTSPSLEQQAQAAYEQGQYQTAVELLQQAAQQYTQQGEPVNAAIALSNLSLTYQQLGNWQAAEDALNQAESLMRQQAVPLGIQAQILDVRGQLHFAQGELDPALTAWQQTAEMYAQLGDEQRQILSRLHQAQALQAKGLFQQVFRTLEDLAANVDDQLDPATKATILRQLGDSLRATGNLPQAEEQLEKSSEIAQQLNNETLIAAAALSLGNLEQGKFKVAFERQEFVAAKGHAEQALEYYKQVAQLDQGELGIQARLNLMRLLTNPSLERWETVAAFYPTVKGLLPQLPPGRATVLAYVGLAENLITLRTNSPLTEPSWREIASLLVPVQSQAKELGDPRSQSLVLGTLGRLYEETEQWDVAQDFSRQALALAQTAQADDIRYRWEWQLGRILKAQGDEAGAIAAYTRAFETLKVLRSDLVTANPDVQFSFRESVEPIYRELVDLLVSSVPEVDEVSQLKADTSDNQARLRQARDVMEALQVAELENFFQAACIDKEVSIDQVVNEKDTTAAVVYAMLLSDRLEVILKLPQRSDLVHYAAATDRKAIDDGLKRYRDNLTSGDNVEADGRQLYAWLLKPAVDQGLLPPESIKTLIFVLDGNLRLIPMATLHDGEDFLVKKYALSLVLGLDVRDPEILPPRNQTQVLAASLENPPPDQARFYSRLPGVTQELAKIAATDLPSTLLQDAAFTGEALNRQLRDTDFTIVHLATHGQFGSDRQNTYILAADGRITIDTLGQIFQSRRQADTRLEMLILSACKTATGNSREVLGIAGAMVQSGARSTIATLWSVDDEASVLFTETLYTQLAEPGVSRAEALRRAQVVLLEQYPGRPRFWAPYVLVGSWR